MWGRRGGNPQIARSRSRQRFWHEDGNGVPGGLERSLKMKRLNPDERQRRFESEQAESLRASGQGDMSFQEAPQLLLFHFFQFVRLHKFEIEDVVRFAAQDVGKAAGHPRAKIETDWTKNSGDTAGHVFTTMLSDAFNNRDRAAIPDSEALTSLSCDVELARSGAIQNRVAYQHIATLGGIGSRLDDDRAAGKAFADVVVRFAKQV